MSMPASGPKAYAGIEGVESLHLPQPEDDKPSLLLVDDNPQSLLALETLLAADDRIIVKAQCGEEALKHLLDKDYCVVLLDIKLTGIDGYETCSRIRATAWGTSVKMIAVSGWARPEDQQRSAAAGFDMHLVKPVDPRMIIEIAGS